MGKGKSSCLEWLYAHVDYQGDECLPWPFSVKNNGYGQFGANGVRGRSPHREMCILVHGAPPTSRHEAAHSCNKRNCMNPRHLSWKTRSENQLDRAIHGTKALGTYRRNPKLSAEKAVAIRALQGKYTQAVIAAQFGVSDTTVRAIFARRLYKEAM